MNSHIEGLLEEGIQLYRRLKKAAEDQFKSLEQDDMGGFSEASGRRDMIRERISKLDGRMGRASKVRNEDQRMREALKETESVIQQILDLDRRMVEMASEKRDKATLDLERLKTGRKGVRGYGKAGSRSPKFVDQQG